MQIKIPSTSKSLSYAFLALAGLLFTSCSSYQNVSDTDGIYSTPTAEIPLEDENTSEKSNYYQQYFNAKGQSLGQIPEEDAVFTDVEGYSTTETLANDGTIIIEEPLEEGYGAWGDNANDITINVYNNGGYGFYGGWYNPWRPYWGWGGFYGGWGISSWGWGGFYGGWGGFYNPWYCAPYSGNYWNGYHNGYYGNRYAYQNRGRSNNAIASRYNNRGRTSVANRGNYNRSRSQIGRSSTNRSVRSSRGTTARRSNNGIQRGRPSSANRSTTRRSNQNARPAARRSQSRPSYSRPSGNRSSGSINRGGGSRGSSRSSGSRGRGGRG